MGESRQPKLTRHEELLGLGRNGARHGNSRQARLAGAVSPGLRKSLRAGRTVATLDPQDAGPDRTKDRCPERPARASGGAVRDDNGRSGTREGRLYRARHLLVAVAESTNLRPIGAFEKTKTIPPGSHPNSQV